MSSPVSWRGAAMGVLLGTKVNGRGPGLGGRRVVAAAVGEELVAE